MALSTVNTEEIKACAASLQIANKRIDYAQDQMTKDVSVRRGCWNSAAGTSAWNRLFDRLLKNGDLRSQILKDYEIRLSAMVATGFEKVEEINADFADQYK